MNTVTAIAILVVLFAIRFLLPVGLIFLINWYNNRVAVNAA